MTIKKDQTVQDAAKKIWENSFNHLAVVSDTGELVGILTAWDISKAVAENCFDSVESVMTKKVLTCAPNEPVDLAARRLDRYGVSAMPVIDPQRRVLGNNNKRQYKQALCKEVLNMKIKISYPYRKNPQPDYFRVHSRNRNPD